MSNIDLFEDVSNPLDSIEEVMANHDWSFERPTPEELTVHVTGRHGQYQMTFIWQECQTAMQFFCEFDLTIPRARYEATSNAIRSINENLWLGHFDVPEDSGTPFFRHTTLFRGLTYGSGTDHVADLIEIALAECEKHYSVFHLLSVSRAPDEGLMNLALIETSGEA